MSHHHAWTLRRLIPRKTRKYLNILYYKHFYLLVGVFIVLLVICSNLFFFKSQAQFIRSTHNLHQHNSEKQRFIFVISSGRAGSGYLAELLGTAPNVQVLISKTYI